MNRNTEMNSNLKNTKTPNSNIKQIKYHNVLKKSDYNNIGNSSMNKSVLDISNSKIDIGNNLFYLYKSNQFVIENNYFLIWNPNKFDKFKKNKKWDEITDKIRTNRSHSLVNNINDKKIDNYNFDKKIENYNLTIPVPSENDRSVVRENFFENCFSPKKKEFNESLSSSLSSNTDINLNFMNKNKFQIRLNNDVLKSSKNMIKSLFEIGQSDINKKDNSKSV